MHPCRCGSTLRAGERMNFVFLVWLNLAIVGVFARLLLLWQPLLPLLILAIRTDSITVHAMTRTMARRFMSLLTTTTHNDDDTTEQQEDQGIETVSLLSTNETTPSNNNSGMDIDLTIVNLTDALQDDPDGHVLATTMLDRAIPAVVDAQDLFDWQRHEQEQQEESYTPSCYCCCFPTFPCFCFQSTRMNHHDDDHDNTTTTTHPPLLSTNDRMALQQKLLRYVRVADRYLHLTSLLLKSKTFYDTLHDDTTMNDSATNKKESSTWMDTIPLPHLPIVQLPRTNKGKPFIPSITTTTTKGDASLLPSSYCSFNISHQSPYCGVARLVSCASTTMNPLVVVGMDIVTIEPLDPNRYESVQDFLRHFQNCFAPTEWETIWNAATTTTTSTTHDMNTDGGNPELTEFHLQWSVKEAYTKALGVGMSLPFPTFQTDFDSGNNVSSLTELVFGTGRMVPTEDNTPRTVFVRGRVTRQDGHPTKVWGFCFVPLLLQQQDSTRQDATPACCCVCVGPLEEQQDTVQSLSPSLRQGREVRCNLSFLSWPELVNWHTKTRVGSDRIPVATEQGEGEGEEEES